MTNKGKPTLINHQALTDNRNDFWNKMSNESNIHKRNLDNARNAMQVYKEFYDSRANKFPKKEKKEKVGKIGMKDLTKIVLDLNQDVKLIKDAQSLQGAQNWIERNGWNGKYGAYQKDVNGDTIPDIVVQRLDSEGNPIDNDYVIVNGYTTTDSTYPYRHAYYTQYPTRQARNEAKRDGITYRSFINGMYNPQYEDGMKILSYASDKGEQFEQKLKSAGYSKVIKPNNRSSYQAFCSGVIKPIFDVFKYNLGNNLGGAAFSKIAATIWNQAILIPAMMYVYGEDVMNVSDEEWKKLRNKKDVKNAIKYRVIEYLDDLSKTFEFVPIFTAIVNNELNTSINPKDPKLEYELKARLLNIPPPITDEKRVAIDERWAGLLFEYI